MFKKDKISENLGKNVQNLKIFFFFSGGMRAVVARNKLLEQTLNAQ